MECITCIYKLKQVRMPNLFFYLYYGVDLPILIGGIILTQSVLKFGGTSVSDFNKIKNGEGDD